MPSYPDRIPACDVLMHGLIWRKRHFVHLPHPSRQGTWGKCHNNTTLKPQSVVFLQIETGALMILAICLLTTSSSALEPDWDDKTPNSQSYLYININKNEFRTHPVCGNRIHRTQKIRSEENLCIWTFKVWLLRSQWSIYCSWKPEEKNNTFPYFPNSYNTHYVDCGWKCLSIGHMMRSTEFSLN